MPHHAHGQGSSIQNYSSLDYRLTIGLLKVLDFEYTKTVCKWICKLPTCSVIGLCKWPVTKGVINFAFFDFDEFASIQRLKKCRCCIAGNNDTSLHTEESSDEVAAAVLPKMSESDAVSSIGDSLQSSHAHLSRSG